MLDNLRNWFDSLEPRERVMVVVGGTATALTLVYLMIVEPYIEHRRDLSQQVEINRDTLAWMEGAKAEIQALERAGRETTAGGDENRSLFGIVDETAQSADLGQAVRQIQPEGDHSVRVNLSNARFDYTVRWFDELETRHGIRVDRLSFEPSEDSGRINASLTLEREEDE